MEANLKISKGKLPWSNTKVDITNKVTLAKLHQTLLIIPSPSMLSSGSNAKHTIMLGLNGRNL